MKFRLMTIAALAFGALATSCSKEPVHNNPPEEGYAKLTLSLTNPVSKALDAETEGQSFSDAMLFVADNSGSIINHYYVGTIGNITAGSTTEFTTKTTASRIFVVGNLGTASAYYSTFGITGPPQDGAALSLTLAQLQAKTIDLTGLNSKTDHTGNNTDGALPVAGYSPVINWVPGAAANGTDYGATVALTMELLPVRLDITVNNLMTNYEENDAYRIKDVAVIYSAFQSHLIADPESTANSGQLYIPAFPTTLPSTPVYYRSGYAAWPTMQPDYSSEMTDLLVNYETDATGTWAPGGSASTQKLQRTLYAYASKEKPLIVTVRAECNSDATKVLYYSAVLDGTADLNGETPDYVENGHKYKITINLKGDALNGSGGTIDPEIPSVTGFVEVEVTAASWQATADISKDFE